VLLELSLRRRDAINLPSKVKTTSAPAELITLSKTVTKANAKRAAAKTPKRSAQMPSKRAGARA
jgi:hypothetical protein